VHGSIVSRRALDVDTGREADGGDGVPVRHLLHDGRLEEHRLSPDLRRRDDGLLIYDAGQPTLL
jgi:hypothetical protein